MAKDFTDNWHMAITRLEREKQLIKGYAMLLQAWLLLNDSQNYTICCNDKDIDHAKVFCCLHSTAFNLVEGCLEYGNYKFIEQPLSAMTCLPDCNEVWKQLQAVWTVYRQHNEQSVGIEQTINTMIAHCIYFEQA
jgi:hypothetical protein